MRRFAYSSLCIGGRSSEGVVCRVMVQNIRWDLSGFVNASDLGWPRNAPVASFDVVSPDGQVVTVQLVQAMSNRAGDLVGWQYVGDLAQVVVFNK